jgi:OmpA family protein
MRKRWVMLVLVMSLVSACATVPTGPNVMVLPGGGKPFDQFQADDVVCRQYAQQQLGLTPGQGAAQSTINTAALGTALGAAAGAAIGAATGHPGTGAAVGAGGGLLTGTAAGAQAGGTASGVLQQRYDTAYVQCMYAKGNQVPGVAAAPSPSAAPPPPPPPGAQPSGPPRH